MAVRNRNIFRWGVWGKMTDCRLARVFGIWEEDKLLEII
jgi:hypothetical protein